MNASNISFQIPAKVVLECTVGVVYIGVMFSSRVRLVPLHKRETNPIKRLILSWPRRSINVLQHRDRLTSVVPYSGVYIYIEEERERGSTVEDWLTCYRAVLCIQYSASLILALEHHYGPSKRPELKIGEVIRGTSSPTFHVACWSAKRRPL